MFEFFDTFRDLTMTSIFLRMVLSVICGGFIGLERTYKRHDAGFRTHILICIGACMTTLIGQYLSLVMGYYTDITRLGAQVIAGVGFIGAGAIIVTQREQVKGLTTAAGLWASAIVGLSLGAGFFEGGLYTTLLILIAELYLSKLEYYIFRHSKEMNLYLEYVDSSTLELILALFRTKGITVQNMEVTRSKGSERHNAGALMLLRLNDTITPKDLLLRLNEMDGILLAAEL
ncbi:MAG: MgtC/SapB family protein [Firmicutes bacterium]|nr:MgtC/SapB family protein [Bacillota bacterium]